MSVPSLAPKDGQSPPTASSHVLHKLFNFVRTVVSLVSGLLLPELKDIITTLGMGVNFNPATDIGTLEGKVILVTGGIAALPSRILNPHNLHSQAMPV